MLKKHLKKIVSLVLVTMMAIGMSITAIAAEPYQNELEAVMDTSPADSGQVTHYDTTTGEMLVALRKILCKRYSTNVKNGAAFCALAGLNSLGHRAPRLALQYARPQGVNAARA